jgi:hypothetical protein
VGIALEWACAEEKCAYNAVSRCVDASRNGLSGRPGPPSGDALRFEPGEDQRFRKLRSKIITLERRLAETGEYWAYGTRIKLVDRRATFVTVIVIAHLFVNIAHGLAHHELRVDFALPSTVFVILVVLIAPLLAMGFTWAAKKRLGLILLSLSMSGSQPWSLWGLTFGLTAYLLLITEAAGTYIGIHFLRKT